MHSLAPRRFTAPGPPGAFMIMERIEKFDDWQQEIIAHKGSYTLRAGRQVGKSEAVGKRRADLMLEYPCSISLMIAPSQRQSSELYKKTMIWLYDAHRKAIEAAGGYQNDTSQSSRRNMELKRIFEQDKGIFNEMPTKTTVVLKKDMKKPQGSATFDNTGSICYSLPAGKTGTYLRTYALDFLDVDEAAYVPDPVYNALTPMLMISAKKRGLGWEGLLSTPAGKGGFFYEACHDDDYKHWHKSSEDCDRFPKDKLLKKKKQLTKIDYAQEYLGEFIDEFQQYFSTALIKKCMTFMRWNFKEDYKTGLRYYYGHDYAGPGKDENASVIAEMNGKKLKIIEPTTDDEPDTHKTNCKIVFIDSKFKFRKLFVDSGGFGCGPTDELTNLLGRRVVGLDNSKKTIDKEGRKGKIFKEDLYSNAKSMMERGEIDIINSTKLLSSLRSMTFEYSEDRNIKIKGKKSHLAEAFVRACWAVKEKGLNIYIY